MKCGKQHTTKWLADVHGIEWIRDVYGKHVAHSLLSHERARMTECMPYIPMYQRLMRKGVKVDALTYHDVVDGVEDEAFAAIAILGGWYHPPSKSEGESVVKQYIQGCPMDGCRGMVEKEESKCVVCWTSVCVECGMVKKDGHVCDEGCVASIKEMQGNTKPCVKCAAPVYKVDGCDQMWCVVCHTAFSWNTGMVESGTLHNPHYYQWLRETSVNGMVPRTIDRRQIMDVMARTLRRSQFMVYVRLNALVTPPTRVLCDEHEYTLHHTRVMYTLGVITEEEWMGRIVREHEMLRYETSIYNARYQLASSLTPLFSELYDLNFRTAHQQVVDAYNRLLQGSEKARTEYNRVVRNENGHGMVNILDGEWEWRL